MNLLIINLDKGIFRPGSMSLANLKDYSRFFEKLFVITWTRREEKSISFENRLFIYPTNSRSRLFYILDTCRIFKKFIKGEGIDLVSSQDPFETGFTAYLISRLFKIPLHLQAHTDFLSLYFGKESTLNKVRVFIAKFLILRADCVRVVSERIKKSLVINGCALVDKIAVFPIFVDVKKIQLEPIKTDLRKKYLQFDFIILMASRLTAEKNIGLAIEAMAKVIKRRPKTGLIIAGEGPKAEALKSQIENYKLQENIILEPWTDDLVSYYKTADLFLLTSNYEGYGMAVVEAMAAGCPVIMTEVGLAGEVLIDKKDGLVVSVGDKEKLVEAILNLIENPALRTNLVQNSQKLMHLWPIREEYLNKYRDSWLFCGKS